MSPRKMAPGSRKPRVHLRNPTPRPRDPSSCKTEEPEQLSGRVPALYTCSFHLLKNMCLFSLVGFKGNLSLLEICFILSRGVKQMEGWEDHFRGKNKLELFVARA